MRYHQIRNATCVLEIGDARILVDPMLGDAGALPPYAVLRYRARRNPLTPLPDGWASTLENVDACLITHVHFGLDCDHLDKAGAAWLAERRVPVYCRTGDVRRLIRRGLVARPVDETPTELMKGFVQTTPASHGRGIVGAAMGPGVGYLIRFPDAPAIYLTGDTVFTNAVRLVLKTYRPSICIVPAGGARLDVGGPILMSLDELATFAKEAPGWVVMNHLGALNHCPHTREEIIARLDENRKTRVALPEDGESVSFNQ
ncbi:MAG: MBL fold metallo-hydrolase [Planctomycetota bacterium]